MIRRSVKNSLRPFFFWGGRVWLGVPILLAVLVFIIGFWRADKSVHNALRLAVLDATAAVGHQFRTYQALEAQPEFDARTVLLLTRQEVNQAQDAPGSPVRLSLQSIAVNENLLYDARLRRIVQYDITPTIGLKGFFGKLGLNRPVRHVDQELATGWKLRAVITGGDYLRAQARQLAISGFISFAILTYFVVPRFYRKMLDLRHYEALVDKLLNVRRDIKSENDFIARVPALVRESLDLDTVAIYWVGREALVSRGSSSAEPDSDAEKPNTEVLIPLNSDRAEAVAVRTKLTILLRHRRRGNPVRARRSSLRPAHSIAVPIHDPAQGGVVGVLSAWRIDGLQPHNTTELESVARLLLVLVEHVRSTLRLEETYRAMIGQSRQAALGAVTSILAHNLKSPLVGLAVFTSQLAEKWSAWEREKVDTQLRQIVKTADHCSALIDRIRRYQTLGEEKSEKPVDLMEVLVRICDFFDLYFEGHQIQLERYFEAGFQPYVAIDELDLQQVITNLFTNADEAFRDAKRQGPGCVVQLHVTRTASGVLIRVADNGPGVPPDDQARIFRGFTTKDEGTGAGLPYCLNVITRAGGTLEYEPEHTPGASFRITLPTKRGLTWNQWEF
jgi:signal transduction histidine kinase